MALLQPIKPLPEGEQAEGQAQMSPGLRSVGATLRQQREFYNLDLSQVAQALKIKPAYLAAIEEGRLGLLPGPAYSVGFVRAYSNYLGLDSAEILRRFKLEAAGLDNRPGLTFPVPLRERSMPSGRMLLVALILTVAGYGAWYHWFYAQGGRPERVTEVPASLLPPEAKAPAAKPASAAHPPSARATPSIAADSPLAASGSAKPAAPDAATAGTPASNVAEPVPQALPEDHVTSPVKGDSPAVPANSGGAPPAPAAAVATPPPAPPRVAPANPAPAASPTEALAAPVPPTQDPSPHTYGATEGAARIVVRATADTWIQVRGEDHTVLFSGVLKPGDTYRVPDRPGLTMRAGNAGGLDIAIDGKPAPALGPAGAVRNVALDPQALMADSSGRN